jgi:hypothetical protein
VATGPTEGPSPRLEDARGRAGRGHGLGLRDGFRRVSRSPGMSDPIRELLADLPLANMIQRPEGMLAIRRSEVPEDQQAAVDAWVESHGGAVARDALFQVHNGKTPDLPGTGDAFYVLPPAAFSAL